jgi:hypothetical protein
LSETPFCADFSIWVTVVVLLLDWKKPACLYLQPCLLHVRMIYPSIARFNPKKLRLSDAAALSQ